MLVPSFAEEWAEAEDALEALEDIYNNTAPLVQRRRAAAHRKRDALRGSEHVPVSDCVIQCMLAARECCAATWRGQCGLLCCCTDVLHQLTLNHL